MTIPKTFKLMGSTWTVKIKEDVTNQDHYGICDHDKRLITLHTKVGGQDIHVDKVEETFLHELTHAILECLHKRELNLDEELVCGIAGLLHQFERTKE